MSDKKRVNVWLDAETYEEFKAILSVTGEKMTDIFTDAMVAYNQCYKDIIASDGEQAQELLAEYARRKLAEIEEALETTKTKKSKGKQR